MPDTSPPRSVALVAAIIPTGSLGGPSGAAGGWRTIRVDAPGERSP